LKHKHKYAASGGRARAIIFENFITGEIISPTTGVVKKRGRDPSPDTKERKGEGYDPERGGIIFA